ELQLVRGQHDGVSPELLDGNLEGHPRPGGGLLEEHGHGLAPEHAADVFRGGLEFRRALQELVELTGGEIVDGEEVPEHRPSLAGAGWRERNTSSTGRRSWDLSG